MTVSDPIADMLTRVRNANLAMHDEVLMPCSKMKESLAAVLKREGYIKDFSVEPHPTLPGNRLRIELKYSADRERVISGIKRVSKPGLRVYSKSTEVQRVLGGLGVAVLSTSKGLMTDREARRNRMGGEVICHVW